MEKNYEVDLKSLIEEMNNEGREKFKLFKNSTILPINQNSKNVHIKKLLRGDDYGFISNLYRVLLHRTPDNKGLKYYSTQLKRGKSRLEVIKQIMHSEERKKTGVKIKRLFLYSFLNSAGIKSFLKFLGYMLVFPRIIIQQNQLQQTVNDLQNLTESLTNNFVDIHETITYKLQCQKRQIEKLLNETGVEIDQQIFNWDEFYKDFENVFRGSVDEIKNRMSVFVPVVQEVRTRIKDFTLLDIGCGRGEWLDILKENHLNALGVDLNKETVEICNQRSLNVAHDDALQYLSRQPVNSYGFVTAFHIIEHMTFFNLLNLLDEIKRTLKEGGGVILETPNPLNVMVACCSFYCDPTHKRPIPPDLLKYLLTLKGFKDVKIVLLHPVDGLEVQEDSELARRFNDLFYGPRDYAVIGYK